MATQEMDLDPPVGQKRKAVDDPSEEPGAVRRIKALDPDVVNKIAAGEIIVAPVNALKELIENAVDAGSTSIDIVVKEGGLKLLQITDNGGGIHKDDLAILCQRHTTSKIDAFEDLASIQTYGFRGEALASISHVSHLTITTKTPDSDVAWRAHFLDGQMVPAKPGQTADPKATAGRNGTQIVIEDIFYNFPTRRRAFRSPSEEYNKMINMVGRYSIHCEGVAFTCKKQTDSATAITVQASASVPDRIRQIYGPNVANELIEFTVAESRWGFQAKGWATNANYHLKKMTLLLFINHRSVESANVKKAVDQIYSSFLPKGGHPFVYLSLEIDPSRVDVNIHPTKREVHFLNEDEILLAICEHVRSKLAAVDSSRTFVTQTLLPGGQWVDTTANPGSPAADASAAAGSGSNVQHIQIPPGPKRARKNSNSLVRTDTSLRKITSMFPAATTAAGASELIDVDAYSPAGAPGDDTNSGRGSGQASGSGPGSGPKSAVEDDTSAVPENVEYTKVEREVVICRLGSVKELRQEVRDNGHGELTEIFSSHTFVGIVDEQKRLAAIQAGVKLYLVDYGLASREFFYQTGLTNFGNFGVIQFTPALDVRELLRTAAKHEKKGAATVQNANNEVEFKIEELVEQVAQTLLERREMLLEYFSLEITPTGELLSIPLLLRGYSPAMVKLPQFLLRLGPCVDWKDEKECFESFLRELATFYVPEALPPERQSTGQEQEESLAAAATAGAAVGEDLFAERRKNLRWAVEHVFFPAFKSRLVATNSLMSGGVMEVADLKGLYRVFERC